MNPLIDLQSTEEFIKSITDGSRNQRSDRCCDSFSSSWGCFQICVTCHCLPADLTHHHKSHHFKQFILFIFLNVETNWISSKKKDGVINQRTKKSSCPSAAAASWLSTQKDSSLSRLQTDGWGVSQSDAAIRFIWRQFVSTCWTLTDLPEVTLLLSDHIHSGDSSSFIHESASIHSSQRTKRNLDVLRFIKAEAGRFKYNF